MDKMRIINIEDIKTGVLNTKHESTFYVDKEVNEGSMRCIWEYDFDTGINPVYIRLDRMWQRILTIFDCL